MTYHLFLPNGIKQIELITKTDKQNNYLIYIFKTSLEKSLTIAQNESTKFLNILYILKGTYKDRLYTKHQIYIR